MQIWGPGCLLIDMIDADRAPPSSYPVFTNGVVVGIGPGGEDCDARIGTEELRRRVSFIGLPLVS
jgi:hypothetical protein